MEGQAVRSVIGYGRRLDIPFAEAVARAREVLKTEGFGVLCEIDVREKMKEKLGVEFRNYVILGACNPSLALEALKQDLNVGLLLPCNVVVYEEADQSVVAAIDAQKMMTVMENPTLASAAAQVNGKLHRAIDRL
ncbi:MAG: DUF302 domain-containing protein [Acidobacteria bacterium]|nr:DUF302 domain-containing protein [Acidobacteriota bacterium]